MNKRWSIGKSIGLILASMATCCYGADKPSSQDGLIEHERKRVIVLKADGAKQIEKQTEAEQLQKAKAASQATKAREQKVLKRQAASGWQESQLKKAQASFDARQSRESKYLNDAKAAAKQERKIPKSK